MEYAGRHLGAGALMLCVITALSGCADGERLGGIEQDPAHSGERPNLPFVFGDWGIYQRSDRSSVYYTTEDFSAGVSVSVYSPGEFDARIEDLESPEVIRNWWCGSYSGIVATAECFTLAFDEEVNLSSEQLSPEDLAGFGDQLLTAWQEN